MVGTQAMSDKLRDKTPLSAEPQSCDMEHAQQWFADQGKPSLKLDYPPLVSLAAEFTKARSEVLCAARLEEAEEIAACYRRKGYREPGIVTERIAALKAASGKPDPMDGTRETNSAGERK